MEGQVGRADNQDPLGKAPELQLADEKSRHDRLPCAGVIGKEETNSGQLEQVVVDCFKLMGQRVDARDRETEVWIELVGDAERVGLNAKPKEMAITVERILCAEDGQVDQDPRR